MATTEKLSKWVVDFDYSMLPPQAIENIKISILDTIGCALIGRSGEMGPIVEEYISEEGGSPQARVLGSGTKTSLANASFANGTFAHADDYDDVGGLGHPGVVLVPYVLALGEKMKISGKKAIEDYAVGFEVGAKIGPALGTGDSIIHGTGLNGTIAATAGAAHMLGLDVKQTRNAFGIGASMAAGLQQNFGTDGKAMHAGNAAKNGILAATLAKKGFTGDEEIFEAIRGFVVTFGNPQRGNVRALIDGLGKNFAIGGKHMQVKVWPCGAGGHGALTMMERLIKKYDLKPEDVVSIDIIHAGANFEGGGYFRHNPKYGYEGKFSKEFQMATMLVDRELTVKSYTNEKLARPAIQDLIKKVKVYRDPEIAKFPQPVQSDFPMDTRMVVKLKDGKVLNEKEGHGRELDGKEIDDKFLANCKEGGIPAKKANKALELIKNLENVKDINEVVDNCCK